MCAEANIGMTKANYFWVMKNLTLKHVQIRHDCATKSNLKVTFPKDDQV